MLYVWHDKENFLTHHTDKAVMTMMNMKNIIDRDYTSVDPNMNMGKLVHAISSSRKRLYSSP